ncbi:MAG: DUF362 domain-containing protein [candidate division Zixibacteria bacterium]|nr:DUF362 domain-containing protein [candidate division Zixibacteria bacterium]
MYKSMNSRFDCNRRDFVKAGGIVTAGIVLGTPALWAQEKYESGQPERIKTNIDELMKVPRTKYSLPGLFPGRTVEVHDKKTMVEGVPQPEPIKKMFETGLQQLTGRNLQESFQLFFDQNDVVGIKVNPVGPGLISTRLELVDAIVAWLEANGIKRNNIVIWDRMDYMLTDAGFTSERYPGIDCVGLHTMDEKAMDPESTDDSRWLDADGNHVSAGNFDIDVYYWADVEAPQDKNYLNQHVFNNKYSYIGKLLTQRLTKIINVPVFKNTGNGISVATKNMGYAAICNTGRLHRPLFFDVCTEVLALPVIRDRLVLNIADGLRAQYEGGPMANAKFAYEDNTIFFATDPFAMDMVCQKKMVEKRKEMKIDVDEHPRWTEYLRYAERLGLGVVDPDKTEHIFTDITTG